MSKLGTNPTPKMNFYPEYVPATRPAAPVEGLETVGYVTTSPTGAEVFQRKPLVPGHGQFGYKQDAVVTRSQADELLAAERAETMRQVKHWSELYKQQHYRAEKAEAIIAAERAEKEEAEDGCLAAVLLLEGLKSENAALSARVEELELIRDSHSQDTLQALLEKQALETQLAAARKAARSAHDTLIELSPSNYNHDDVCQMNNASVEAIFLLADVLGETHGKTAEWWKLRRAALEAKP